MYICEKHGILDSEWCDKCKEIKPCNCSDLTNTRYKDLILDCEDGERTFTIYVTHCSTCGRIFEIKQK